MGLEEFYYSKLFSVPPPTDQTVNRSAANTMVVKVIPPEANAFRFG